MKYEDMSHKLKPSEPTTIWQGAKVQGYEPRVYTVLGGKIAMVYLSHQTFHNSAILARTVGFAKCVLCPQNLNLFIYQII